jgi:tetratricopeptide (TPR) repeat protein
MRTIRLAGAVMVLAMGFPATAQAQDACTRLQAQSDAFKAELDQAFALMQQRDIAGASKLLPRLEEHLGRVPAAMPGPQRCGAQVAVFDHHQFIRFDTLRRAGKPVPGYPAGTAFVEKPLNFHPLAYAVGWLHYENGAYDKALAAYAKGLAIAPGDHDLSNEYVATLLNQKNYAAIVPFVDRFMAADTDIDSKARASMLGCKAIAQVVQGDASGGKATLALAMQLDPASETLKGLAAQLE